MADTNLSTSISAIRTKILNDAPTATVDELVSLARAAKSIGLTEDTSIETAINSRANTLSSNASTNDMVKLSNAIKQLRNTTAGAVSPSTTSDDIVEGTSNLYYTDARTDARIALNGASVESSDTAPTSPSDGDVWFKTDTLDLYVYYQDSDSSQWVQVGGVSGTTSGGGGSSSSIQWTRFYFDRGGATPGSAVNNSENVGKNFGSWTETTSANTGSTYVTPTSSTYDPTLTGITVNSNGEFQFPAGVYEVSASIQFKIYNTSSNLQKYDFYLYGESGSNWAGSYDEQLLVPSTSLLVNNDMMIKMSGLYVFEDATQANNILYLQMGTGASPVNANMFPDYGFLNIKKIG
jgi:hypothetical protein